MTYVKLFQSILQSTLWQEPTHVRLVWITLLAMCDFNGNVSASIPGLAHTARVELKEAEAAIQKLLSPDPYSRTPDYEGRRIEVIDGGWHILNYIKYKQIVSAENAREGARLRQQKHRDASRPVTQSHLIDIEIDIEKEKKTTTTTTSEPKAPQKKSKPVTKKLNLGLFDEEVRVTANTILDLTPEKDASGRVIVLKFEPLASRIDGLLKTYKGELTGDLLLGCWKAYLKEPSVMLKAPHYFFGEAKYQKGGANWEDYIKGVSHFKAKEQAIGLFAMEESHD